MGFCSITLDLDGTLVDSVPDLTLACQAMLDELGEPATSETEIRTFVGEGMANLVNRCLGRTLPVNETRLATGIEAFRRHYHQVNGQATKCYPGVVETLAHWQNMGVPMACVTNKPMEFTLPLLEQLDLARFFSAIIAGDSCAHKKPHPEPILLACRKLGSLPVDNLHIGDSRHDLAAARAAGCTAGGVPYGYNCGEPLLAEECDLFFPSLAGFTGLGKAHGALA